MARFPAERAGHIDLTIPTLPKGSYFSDFLEPRRTPEKALVAVIQEAHVHGVSKRAVDDLVRAIGGEEDQMTVRATVIPTNGVSKSHESGLRARSVGSLCLASMTAIGPVASFCQKGPVATTVQEGGEPTFASSPARLQSPPAMLLFGHQTGRYEIDSTGAACRTRRHGQA